MSSADIFHADKGTHFNKSSFSFFTEADVIELEWLIQNGLFDLSRFLDILDITAQDVVGGQSYGIHNEAPPVPDDFQSHRQGDSQSRHHAAPNRAGRQALDRPPHSHPPLPREMESPYTNKERMSEDSLSSSGIPPVELQGDDGNPSARRNELARTPRDHLQAGVTQNSDIARGEGGRQRGSQMAPSQKVWRWKPYVYRPPVAKNKSQQATTSTPNPSTPTSSSFSSSANSSSSSTPKCENEVNSPESLSTAPLEELKMEEKEPATVSSKKRRGRVLFKHVPYDPRKLQGSQSTTTEFIEWGGPTDESFWGRRAFDERDNGKRGI